MSDRWTYEYIHKIGNCWFKDGKSVGVDEVKAEITRLTENLHNQAVIMEELRETIERNKFGEKITELISERGLAREQNEHLTERVKELEIELKAEREVVDFYGDIKYWQDDCGRDFNYCLAKENDQECFEYKNTDKIRYYGGKRARQRQAERKL